MTEGVTIFYPQTCVIDTDVEIGSDTTIEPFVQILGKTHIGSDCRIRSYSVINDSVIGDDVLIRQGCVLDEAHVMNQAQIGPYSHLRPGSEIGEGSKANHLSYLGDARIGEGVNIGAGTITCNYDGERKHATVIEDGVFIGSDSTLVAPVNIAKGAYVGAASCITDDVPPDSLAIGRARQIVKEGWIKARRASKKASQG
jgi:bifunctional UDP-N-acetylglucosamine pyrophosphorylase/glucosamine-1-phosphate N-acetyltransferase